MFDILEVNGVRTLVDGLLSPLVVVDFTSGSDLLGALLNDALAHRMLHCVLSLVAALRSVHEQ